MVKNAERWLRPTTSNQCGQAHGIILKSYPEGNIDESAVIDRMVPSGSTSVEEWDCDSALEWDSGVNGIRSCKTPPTG